MKTEQIGSATLYLGDCREILPTLGSVDTVLTDPPYEAAMQDKWGVLSRNAPSSHVRYNELDFASIDHMRDSVAHAVSTICRGWGIFFCMAEGVRAWRDSIEATGARYKRAMVWVKPDAMPQFNGQGPSVGHEMLVSAWYGQGYSRWNGGGRPGVFTHVKNTPGGSVHPTQKPLPLMLELVELFSDFDATVCDPFMGSGTTGVACLRLGRKFVGVEIAPLHFDAACKRLAEAARQPDMLIAARLIPKQSKVAFDAE